MPSPKIAPQARPAKRPTKIQNVKDRQGMDIRAERYPQGRRRVNGP